MSREPSSALGTSAGRGSPSAAGIDAQPESPPRTTTRLPESLALKSLPSLSRTPSASGTLEALALLSSPRSSPGGPRSRSPLPPRPTSSPRNASGSPSLPLPTFMSPTASSTNRSSLTGLPDQLVIHGPSSLSSPSSRVLNASPIVGELHKIKEEENEDHSESGRSRNSSAASTSLASGRSRDPSIVMASGQESQSQNSSPSVLAVPTSSGSASSTHLGAATTSHTSPKAKANGDVFDRLFAGRPSRPSTPAERETLTAEHTFQPNLAKVEKDRHKGMERREDGLVFERLYKQGVGQAECRLKAAEIKAKQESASCSFAPRLVTEEYKRLRGSPSPPAPEHAADSPPVHERLYKGLEKRLDYFEKAEKRKSEKETHGCTFIPAILKTPVAMKAAAAGLRAETGEAGEAKEGVGRQEETEEKTGEGKKESASKKVWERLYHARVPLEAKKARQRQEYEDQVLPFRPELVTKTNVREERSRAGEQAGSKPGYTDAHGRLYEESIARRQRALHREVQMPEGCTFQPNIQVLTLKEQSSVSMTRAGSPNDALRMDAMYRRGTEKGKQQLEHEIASRPPPPKSDEEECTFFPQTNVKAKRAR